MLVEISTYDSSKYLSYKNNNFCLNTSFKGELWEIINNSDTSKEISYGKLNLNYKSLLILCSDSDKWNIQTNLIKDDGDYYYYEATIQHINTNLYLSIINDNVTMDNEKYKWLLKEESIPKFYNMSGVYNKPVTVIRENGFINKIKKMTGFF